MDARRELLQLLDGRDARVDDQRTAVSQQRIPVNQLLRIAAALGQLFEQRVALGQGLGVFAQRPGIAGHASATGPG